MKVHRTPPEYTITEDDAEMVAQMVQDRTFEDFENVVCQRDIIEEEMEDMRQLLRQIGEAGSRQQHRNGPVNITDRRRT
jgi:hypothetical protein